MPLQNLEQIRAKHALSFAKKVTKGEVIATGKEGGDAMKKIPSMIMTNGLLASIAFAIEEKKDKKNDRMVPRSAGHREIFNSIAEHLSSPEIEITPDAHDAKSLLDDLSQKGSQILKLATEESLAWLSYARRFISGGEGDGGRQEEDVE